MNIAYKPYRYVKAPPMYLQKHEKRAVHYIALSSIALGLGTFIAISIPIAMWQLTTTKAQELLVPIITNRSEKNSNLILGVSNTPDIAPSAPPVVKSEDGQPIIVAKLADGFSYFHANTTPTQTNYDTFSLAIPKLKIPQALVRVNSLEFEKNLGHLPGTALPGQVGNVFVTGHSALPAFFSATNYKTIFSTLPKLQILDEIIVNAQGKTYRYVVEKTTVVEPTEIGVIKPPDSFGKYLTLMTCVPPGLNTKRLIVLARLSE